MNRNTQENNTVIELLVNNHPGVMSHITGLFMRRAFNIEGILCGRVQDGSVSRIYLLVQDNAQLPKVIKQVEKLYDVLELKKLDNSDTGIFDQIPELVTRVTV